MDDEKYISALIDLHIGLDRQGPGDPLISKQIIDNLPGLPSRPRIADLGCGAGAGALILAEKFRCRVKAVDLARAFLDQLVNRARQQGLEQFIEVVEGDIGNLGWSHGSMDLIWSEGAAYNINFNFALKCWRPLMAANGIAVLSEMNYFSNDIPVKLKKDMENLYPEIRTESKNAELISASGFELLGVHRLPSEAWWENYYNPLAAKIARIKRSADKVMQAVINETETEMGLFAEYHKQYGYTFYIMRAI